MEFGARLALHHEDGMGLHSSASVCMDRKQVPNLVQDLLIGPCKQVWTFWVDMLIICVGVLDLWLGPGLGGSSFVVPGLSAGPEAH